MSEVLQANVFFFITSIAVIVFSLLLCVLLYHAIKVVKAAQRIIERIEVGSEAIAEDVANLREYFVERSLISQILGIFLGRREKSRSRKAKTTRKKTELTITDET